MKIVFVLFL